MLSPPWSQGHHVTVVSTFLSYWWVSGPQSRLEVLLKWVNSWGTLPCLEVLVTSL